MYRLVLTEKKSVAQSISAVLGANKRENGFFIGNGYIVSWAAGHLLELAAPDFYDKKYTKWRYSDLPIIPSEWKYTAIKGKSAQLKVLTDLMNRADVECVINACDAGREGENIFHTIYNHAKCTKKIFRLWISSMTEAAIKAGFDCLSDGAEYENLAAAAACRERADWAVGINATRLLSIIYKQTLNTGRVQSPTLAMIVKRDADIAAFVKEPFYMIAIENSGMTASGEKQKNKQAAEAIRAACDGKPAVIQSVERQTKTVSPPKLYDLTALQREANRLFGFTAAQTLEYAQSMYEKAILSYPRTDGRYLTSDMRDTVATLITQLQKNTPFAYGMDFTPDIDRFIDDKRVTDHHAIIPTAEALKADNSALSAGEQAILQLVISRLLCAAAPVYSYEAVTATLDCGGNPFTAKGKTVIANGWKEIDTAYRASLKQPPDSDIAEDESSNNDNTALPELAEGQAFESVTANIKEGFTTPPKHFTEDTLLSSMETAGAGDMPDETERRGLGTPATRAAIIEKLIKTGFVEREKKNLISTEKGRNLIKILPPALASARLTAEWEHMLTRITRGEISADEFMRGITSFITTIVEKNNSPNPEFAHLFGSNQNESEPLGVCKRCGGLVREGTKGFFCDSHNCGFKLWKASKFWEAKKKPLTADIVAALLEDGKATVTDLYSEKTGKKYNATVLLDDTGEGYVNFKLKFS